MSRTCGQLVPPETTVGDVVVVVGAVAGLVVVGVMPEPDPVLVAVDDVDLALECAEAIVVLEAPGISVATTPPMSTAVRAAPPVAIPVMRLTLRSAAVLFSA